MAINHPGVGLAGPAAVRFARASDGVRIAYISEGSGPALVFVRGWVSHLELMWSQPAVRRFFSPLLTSLQLVRFDNRANGLSDREVPPVDLEALVSDIEAVVDAVGLDRFTLWGSTFGGPPAIVYASRHPERVERLILEGTFARGADLGSPAQQEQFLGLLAGASLQPNAVYAALSYMSDPEPVDSHRDRVRRTRASIDAERVYELYSLAYRVDVSDLLSELPMPGLVLHRRRSRAIPFDHGRRLAALMPRAELVALEGEAHNVWEGDAGPGLAAVADFLGLDASVHPLPLGLQPVSVMLTDIVDSTVLAERLGDSDARHLFAWHDRLMRATIAANAGTVVNSTGDGVIASFKSATDALTAATAIQEALAEGRRTGGHDLRVRVGLTAGEPLAGDGDLHGWVMHLVSRVCAQAGADQILTSGVVRELARGKDFRFRNLGERVLKGIDEPVALFEVEQSGPRDGGRPANSGD